jgi:hypothetical protein
VAVSHIEVYRVSQYSAVCIVTSYWLNDRGVGVRVAVGSRIFISPYRPDRLWGPTDLLSDEYRGLFHRGKADGGSEADLSPPTTVEVKKTWVYPLPHTP